MPGLEFYLLPGAEKADGLEGQRRGQAAKKPRSRADVTTEVQKERRARMAAGPRRESGRSLEDTRGKTSITTGVIVTNRVVKY